MAFRVAARIILELGDELISSDSVALYELVKNSIDAGSEWVSISVQVVLRRSYFQEAIEAIDEGRNLHAVRKRLLSNIEKGAPVAPKQVFRDTILNAGDDRASLRATLADTYDRRNWILVRDRGHGMTARELPGCLLDDRDSLTSCRKGQPAWILC